MDNKINYDKNLWFEHLGCEGKHYLIGNPHTYVGRMWAWCPKEKRSIFITKADMGKMSNQTKYWVEGFLFGNQPKPPTDIDGMVDFQSEEYKNWEKDVELFRKTGYWTEEKRDCIMCGKLLMPSESNEFCGDCKT